MKSTFFKLTKEKQLNLLNACIDEFSKNQYNAASINRIIEKAQISKGGLFKYIENKKDLYLYTIEEVLREVIEFQSQQVDYNKTCYFDRLKNLIGAGFSYYKKHKSKFKVALNSFTDFTSPCHEDVMELRKCLIEKHQSHMLKKIDWQQYKIDKEEVLKVSLYLLNGYNITFIQNMMNKNSIEVLEEETLKDIDLLFNVIKEGAVSGIVND